ncbi:MAG: bifunctional phosphoglucose/phosphomannose isomerase [Thermoplasmatota archaeon]
MDLDDLEGMASLDPSGMLKEIAAFPRHIEDAVRLGEQAPALDGQPEAVLFVGMGGSAIGGILLQQLYRDTCPIPIMVHRGYRLPAWADESTLVVATSYSGNTAETLSCFKQALQRGCKTLSISSNGALEEFSGGADCHIAVPRDMQPRAALAYLMLPPLKILERYGLAALPDMEQVVGEVRAYGDTLAPGVPLADNPAKQLAAGIQGVPLIYGHGYLGAVATRWRQQINENAKMAAADFMVPEASHNELMAWAHGQQQDATCLFLRQPDEPEGIARRYDYMAETYGRHARVEQVTARGQSRLSRLLSLVHLGDYVSVYLALRRDVDPTPVSLIEQLKRRL